jgi:hypothetical protein
VRRFTCRRRPVTAEEPGLGLANACEVYGGQSGNGTGFPRTSVFPCRLNSNIAASPPTLVYLIDRRVAYSVLNTGDYIGNKATTYSVAYILI